MTIKLLKTDSEFLESAANKISIDGNEWYYVPYWFKRLDGQTFEQVNFENLPKNVKESIDSVRK